MKYLLLTSLLLSISTPAFSDQTGISKEKLLELIDSGVEEAVILELVRRDCVDFPVAAEDVLELSPQVPPEILRAAIACKEQPAATEIDSEDRLSEGQAFDLRQVETVAVIPAILDGTRDEALTAALIAEIRKQRQRYRVIDPVETTAHADDRDSFDSSAPLEVLLDAARARDAQAILLATALTFRRLEDPGVRVELKLVETRQGKVLWSGGEQGVSNFFNWQAAKKNAARNSVGVLPP